MIKVFIDMKFNIRIDNVRRCGLKANITDYRFDITDINRKFLIYILQEFD